MDDVANTKWLVLSIQASLFPMFSCVGGQKRAWYTYEIKFPWLPYTLTCYTMIIAKFNLSAERPHCKFLLPVRQNFEVRSDITLTALVCIFSFKVIFEL